MVHAFKAESLQVEGEEGNQLKTFFFFKVTASINSINGYCSRLMLKALIGDTEREVVWKYSGQ